MYNDNREVNINCFTQYGLDKPVIEYGSSIKNINWSSIQTKLIQLAGRLCNSYASDIIIDINSIADKMKNNELANGDFFLFGFREMGVDHNNFIACKKEYELRTEYREIWKMDVKTDMLDIGYDGIQFSLYRVSYDSNLNKCKN